jgi:L-histidine N-alpha-methyltransferase
LSTSSTVTVDVLVHPGDFLSQIRADAARGLTATPKELPPKWFYDDRGSELFERITRLPEYYPTRREREILRNRSAEIVAVARADTLVELGSGTSEKTRLLLRAMRDAGTLRRFVPFDVSEQTLRRAASAVADEYEGIEITAIAGDFERHLDAIPREGHRLIAFLGGTIGNLYPPQRAHFLRTVAEQMGSRDAFLLGTDLVKDASRLHAAYNDAEGVTAEFNKNVLLVLNQNLGSSFDPVRFGHVARWDAANEWIEMALRANSAFMVEIPDLDLTVAFKEDEEMRTEISARFRPEGLRAELAAAGLRLVGWWTDVRDDFAVSLSVPEDRVAL